MRVSQFSAGMILTVVLFAASFAARAQDLPQMDPETLHQGVVAGCEYEINHSPKMASLPPGLGDAMCTCVDKWYRDNNLNTMEDIKANESMIPKVMVYC